MLWSLTKTGAVLVLLFALLAIAHLPLLHLPYFWDEAGYFIPAALEIYTRFEFIPQITLSNAHPPLFPAYLALCWKLFGNSILVTRLASCFIAAGYLLTVYKLARRTSNSSVARATCICFALYPVFFAQTTLAHLDMTAALFALLGLYFYLPDSLDFAAQRSLPSNADKPFSENETITHRFALINCSALRLTLSTICFGLSALAKETAILVPATIVAWNVLCLLFEARKKLNARTFTVKDFAFALAPMLSFVPLAVWFAYHFARTGFVFGNPEFVRYNVTATLSVARLLAAFIMRVWHVTGYMNLFALTLVTVVAMRFAPRNESKNSSGAAAQRPRIDTRVQLLFLALIVTHVLAFSVIGGALLARYLLPVLPLLFLICVSTLRRRARCWQLVVALVCFAFVVGWFINPLHRFPFEENLAYRHYIASHQRAARIVERDYANAVVLTAWTASDELAHPYLGYVARPIQVIEIKHFSREELTAAINNKNFNLVLAFSTNFPADLNAAEIASFIGGEIVHHEQQGRLWTAIIKRN